MVLVGRWYSKRVSLMILSVTIWVSETWTVVSARDGAKAVLGQVGAADSLLLLIVVLELEADGEGVLLAEGEIDARGEIEAVLRGELAEAITIAVGRRVDVAAGGAW